MRSLRRKLAPRAKRTEPVLASDFAQLLPPRGSTAANLSDEALIDRLTFAMPAVALRAIEEQVVASPKELDLATIFGMGFPPFHGGFLRWAGTLGASAVEARLAALVRLPGVVDRPGGAERFTVEPSLLATFGMTRSSTRAPLAVLSGAT